MSTAIPPCPKCGGVLRPLATDEYRCRCGFTVGGEAIVAANGDPVWLLGIGKMATPPDAKPGIRISDSFAELSAVCWDRRLERPDRLSATAAVAIRRAAIDTGASYGLEFQHDKANGECLVIPRANGQQHYAKREHLYALAPLGDEIEAARQMVRKIAALGPGRWWSLLDPVHCIMDDGQLQVADVGGVPHVFMRALYIHDPICPACRQPCERVEVAGIMLSGCPCVGKDRAMAVKDRAMAVSLSGDRPFRVDPSKLEKAPTPPGAAIEYPANHRNLEKRLLQTARTMSNFAPLQLTKEQIAEASKASGDFIEAVRARTDKALADMLDQMAHPSITVRGDYGNTIKSLDRAAQMVIEAAQAGIITFTRAKEMLPELPRPFIRGPESGPSRLGPPEETCMVCQRDPRNSIHTGHTAARDLLDRKLSAEGQMMRDRLLEKYRAPATCECFAAHLCDAHRPPVDPLDVEYDGAKLRDLLRLDEDARREGWAGSRQRYKETPAQRAAVSTHRSAELRARVKASEERERQRVVLEVDAEDLPW